MTSEPRSSAVQFSNGVQPIKVRSAPEAAAEAIREAITEGKLRPGQRLVELKLAASLGIGQPTLREALKELEYQGFVYKIPQKGTYIAEFNKKDCRELLEVRLNLEALAISRAARKITPDIENTLNNLVNEMRIAAETLDIPRFRQCDAKFHSTIVALANNQRLKKILMNIISQMLVYGTLGSKPDSRKEMMDGAEEHRQILMGLATGDPTQACAVLVSETLKHWNEDYQLGLSEDQTTYPAVLSEF